MGRHGVDLVAKYGSIANTPDMAGRYPRIDGAGYRNGQVLDDTIRNITGKFRSDDHMAMLTLHGNSGVFSGNLADYDGERYDASSTLQGMTGSNYRASINFDASRQVPTSNEVRPKTVVLTLCIRALDSLNAVSYWIKAFIERSFFYTKVTRAGKPVSLFTMSANLMNNVWSNIKMLKPMSIKGLIEPKVASLLYLDIIKSGLLGEDILFEKRKIAYINQETLMDELVHSLEEMPKTHDENLKIEGIEHFTPAVRTRLEFIIDEFLSFYFRRKFSFSKFKERYKIVDFTAHLFFSKKDKNSFPLHTDPAHVLVVCLDGSKSFYYIDEIEQQGEVVIMQPGDAIFIPAGIHHMGLNEEDSVMVSIGFEPYYSIQKDF